MVKSAYVPNKGDYVSITFDPQSGHDQKGRRPALVLSNYLFNKHTGLVIVCPVTNTNRNFPFHIEVPESSSLTGYIMTEQVKSIDYQSRRVKFIEKSDSTTLVKTLNILEACIYQDD